MSSSSSMIKLKSIDEKIIEVDDKVARMSETLKNLLDDLGNTDDDEPVPLHNVHCNAAIVELIVNWAEHHKDDPKVELSKEEKALSKYRTIPIPEWDEQYFKTHQELIYEIMLAANYLDIEPLLYLLAQFVANMIKACKNAQEVRDFFEIEDDFPPEQKAQIEKEEEWIYGPLKKE